MKKDVREENDEIFDLLTSIPEKTFSSNTEQLSHLLENLHLYLNLISQSLWDESIASQPDFSFESDDEYDVVGAFGPSEE